jgi:8-oxo-dGTP pyrophosphatase MutT (NUDIX family)
VDLTEDAIRVKLAQNQGQLSEEEILSAFLSDAPKPAAVLVPLLRTSPGPDKPPAWHILLTRRSDRLIEHRGQVAFPGGRADPGDPSPEETALREAYEEIGLDPKVVRILGRLVNVWTITNYTITPVVGVIPWPYPLRLVESEVSRAFKIPLAWLADPRNHEVRERLIPSSNFSNSQGYRVPVIYFQPYDGETLWGVSAEITINLIRTLGLFEETSSTPDI